MRCLTGTQLQILILSVLAALIPGCSKAGGPPRAQCVVAPQTADRLAIGLFACRGTWGEVEESIFFVGIRNLSEEPVKVRTRFEPFGPFDIVVMDNGEEKVSNLNFWESASVDPKNGTYLLPRGGVLGRVMDLRCIHPDFGASLSTCVPVIPDGDVEVRFAHEGVWVCQQEPCESEELLAERMVTPPIMVLGVR